MMSENSRSTLVLVFCFLMVTPAQLLGGNGSFIDTDKLQPITFAAFRCLVLHGKWVSHRKLPMIYIIRVIEDAPKLMADSSNGAALRLTHCRITGDLIRVTKPSLVPEAYGLNIREHLQRRGVRDGVYLRLPITLADTTVDPKLYLDSVVIRSPLRFKNVRFLDSVYFQGAVLQSRVDFENVSFEDLADFAGAWVAADLTCSECKFARVANFAHLYVGPGARIYIGGQALNSPLDFSESVFRGRLTLEGDPRTLQVYEAVYLNGVNASLAEPAGELWIKNVEVRGSFYLDQGKWRTIDCAEFQHGIHRPIRFSGFSDFRQSTFRDIDLRGVEFNGLADFSDSTFLRRVNLERIKLQKPIRLEWYQIEDGLEWPEGAAVKASPLSKQTYEELQRNFKQIGDLESENACSYKMSITYEKNVIWFFGYLVGYGVRRRNPFALGLFSLLVFWGINGRFLKRGWFESGPRQGLKARIPSALFLALCAGQLKFEFPSTYERETADVTSISSVPSSSDFEQAITDLGGDPAIPPARNPVVNPVIRNLFSLCASSGLCPGGQTLWPRSNLSSDGDFLNSASPAPSHFRSDGGMGRIDYTFAKNHRLSGSYIFRSGEQSFPLALAAGSFLPRTNTLSRFQAQLAAVSLDSTLSPIFLNQVRIGWNELHRTYANDDALRIQDPAQTIGLETGVTNSRDFGLPQLTVRPFSAVGASPFSNPSGRLGAGWYVSDGIVWNVGKHTLQVGYVFIRSTVSLFDDVNYRGELDFASLRDFLAGGVAAGGISRGTTDRFTIQVSHAAYVRDTFPLVAGLSLDLGLRWDYVGILHERRHLFSLYDPQRGLVVPRRLYETELHDFGPRVALIWDLGNRRKTVLRAGVGAFYDTLPQDVFVGQIQFNTFVPGVAYNAILPRPVLTSKSPAATLQLGGPLFSPGTFSADTSDAWTVDTIRTPYVVSYNANLQRELSRKASLQLAYVGSRGHHLLRVRDINGPAVPGGGRPFDQSAVLSTVAPNRPFVVNQVETTSASSYNSVQISYKQNEWRGWSNFVSWTWSHSIDDASYGTDLFPNQSLPANSQAPGRERASSAFDTRHRFGWNSTYGFDLPARVLWERLRKGWKVSGVLSLNSGTPYQINLGKEFDSQGAYDFILRPDLTGNPLLGTSSPFRFLNLAAFRVPCTLNGAGTDVSNCLPGTPHYGSLPRNAFTGPKIRSLDLTLSKTTKLSERWFLEIRGDLFNVTNSPHFASPFLPHFIASAASKGLDLSGTGGAAGASCNTTSASAECYLSLTNTPDSVIGNPNRSAGGPRTAQLSVKVAF